MSARKASRGNIAADRASRACSKSETRESRCKGSREINVETLRLLPEWGAELEEKTLIIVKELYSHSAML